MADADGSHTRKIAEGDDRNYHFGSWSPDGSRIADTVRSEDGRELWVADADGSNTRKIADHDDLYSDSWSPDGSRIAYTVSSEDGTVRSEDGRELWVADADGSNTRKIADGAVPMGWVPASG